jgi:MFS family permease
MIAAARGSRLDQMRDVLGAVLSNRPLRRATLAFAAFTAAEWGLWIAMLVYAYGRGGATEAAIVAAIQLVPAALVAPIASVLGDRRRPGRVVLASYVTQAAAMSATAAVLLADGPAALAYAGATITTVAITLTRPAMSVLVPTLVRTPDELTAANVVSSWTESLSVLVAPLVTGFVLAVSSPGAVFALMACVVTLGAVVVAPVPGPPPAGAAALEDVTVALRGAVGVLRTEHAVRLLLLVLCADFVALGALDVLYPTLAIGYLSLDDGWVGYLNAAFGAGAVLAVVVTARLVGRRRLVPSMVGGMLAYVLAFVLLAAWPTRTSAIALLALAGAGRVVLDVSARTLLQRTAPPHVLARVFGLLEGLSMAALAFGSLLIAVIVALGGVRFAILGVGLLLPLAALASGRELLSIDRHATVPVVQIGLLRSMSLFAPLDPPTLESLARRLVPVHATVGEAVVREGEPGDRFYVIASGVIRVERRGATIDTIGRGTGFGEIALLRDVPRTASCVASGDVLLYGLDKQGFLAALSHPAVSAEAERLAVARGTPAVADP